MSLRSYQGAAFAIGAGVLVGWLFLLTLDDQAAERPREEVVSPLPQSARAQLEGPRKSAGPSAHAVYITAGGPQPEATRDDERYLSEVVGQAVSGDSALSLVAHYRSRVLVDAEGLEQYRLMLSDPEMLRKVQKDMAHPPEAREGLRDRTKRLMEIGYLRDALAWKENPRREQILTMIEVLILDDNLREGLGMDARFSLAGDKLELFSLLHEHAPGRVTDLIDRAQGSRLGKLLLALSDEVNARADRAREAGIAP